MRYVACMMMWSAEFVVRVGRKSPPSICKVEECRSMF